MENIKKGIMPVLQNKKTAPGEMSPRIIMAIAGSDPSGGAGIQADIKTVSALGGYALTVITAVTAQNTCRVAAVEEVNPSLIKAQLEILSEDIRIDGIKIGMIYTARTAQVIADFLESQASGIPVVLDPVAVSTSGHLLMQDGTIEVIKNRLFPLCTAITPNIPEAEILSSCDIKKLPDMEKSALELLKYGSSWVIVKGGHLCQESACVTDIAANQQEIIYFTGPKILRGSVRGTGCTFSSALTFYLAEGCSMAEAVPKAKSFVEKVIKESLHLGNGSLMPGHFA